MTRDAVRCGRISYTNDLPVYAAFDLGEIEFPGTLRAAVPSELNRALLEGELDISPVSSIFYARHAKELTLFPGICIGSRREAKSIQCISRAHPRALAGARIAVTKESATGRALFDVICRAGYGFSPGVEPSDDPFGEYRRDGSPCVLIGDSAIDAALAAPEHAHDIGALWYGLTGADMVYAVWVARTAWAQENTAVTSAVLGALHRSLAYSRANKARVIELARSTHARPAGFYESYYQALNYSLDAAAQMGLGTFFTMAQKCGVLDAGLKIPQAPPTTELAYDV
jgi:chorismate dehydratase